MYRRSYFSDQKQKLIDLIVARTGTPRSELAAKTIQELEAILDDSLMAQIRAEAAQAAEAADEELIRIQAEREADRILHQLRTQRAQAPQREAEDKRQLTEDRKTFLEACRQYHIGSTDANFSLIRSTLGPGFSAYEIGQAVQSGKLHVSPATPEEIQRWTQEAQEQRQQTLRKMSLEELRSVVRHEAEQRRAQAQREETERQIAHREMLDAQLGYSQLPDTNQHGVKIDAAYLTRISNTNLQLFKNLIRVHGAANVTARLRGIR